MVKRQYPAASQSATQGKAERERGEELQVSMQRNSNGADGARTKHSVFARSKYGLLAPKGTVGNTATTGPLGSGDGPKDTTGTGDTKKTETGTREQDRQCVPPARGHREE